MHIMQTRYTYIPIIGEHRRDELSLYSIALLFLYNKYTYCIFIHNRPDIHSDNSLYR